MSLGHIAEPWVASLSAAAELCPDPQAEAAKAPGTARRPTSEFIASSLWSASLTGAPHLIETSGLRGLYRSQLFHPIASRTYRLSCERRNPRISRALRHVLERMSGLSSSCATQQYSHVRGGYESVAEFEAIKSSNYKLPYILVAGFPRSGTTTLQNLVRNTYPSHFFESKSLNRLSLWEGAKHEIQVAEALTHLEAAEAVLFVAMRNFRDAAASLLVARGDQPTDLNWEARRWREWSALLHFANVIPIAFKDVSSLTPFELSNLMAHQSQIDLEWHLEPGHMHAQLYELARESDVVDPRKSNLPNGDRRELLRQARIHITETLDSRLLHELDDLYESLVLPTPTVYKAN